jgi:hypothetical protein
VRQDVHDFIHGFLESIIHGLGTQKHGIEEDIEKTKNKLLATVNIVKTIVISIVLFSVGIIMTVWGIASYIDQRFAMQGLGFVLIGIIAILAGVTISAYRRR